MTFAIPYQRIIRFYLQGFVITWIKEEKDFKAMLDNEEHFKEVFF
jgi:hypothetical protein